MTITIPGFNGILLNPGDEGYAESAATHYAKGAPQLVARPATAADVAAAVRYAGAEGLELSVRAGGHGTSGVSTNDGGLVIDLTAMDDVEVLDAAVGAVRIGGGATWGHVADSLASHRLALTSGDTRSVGVGGLTLGGGIGWMVRTWGLALDNLIAAEVVLADGSIVTASQSQHPDLFWALRGGGGNFGVVTAFTFAARALDGVVHGTIELDPSRLGEVLKGWRDVMRAAPPKLNSTFMALPAFGPEMPPSTRIEAVWAGPELGEAEAAVAPLLALPGVTGHSFEASAYADVLVENPGPPEGIRIVDLNAFTPDLTDALIDELVQLHDTIGGLLSLRALRGALNDVAADATAFAWRDAEALVLAATFLPPGTPDGTEEGIRANWAGLGHALRGAYGNFSSRRDAIDVIYSPETLERLRSIKRELDPKGLFRGNQVIPA
jgi:FAD/FMN-containing dehydrogenase